MKSKKKPHKITKINRGFLWTVKNTTSNFLFSFNKEKDDFFHSVKKAKFSAKLVIIAIIIVVFMIGTLKITSSMSSNADKEKAIAEIELQIAQKKEENKKLKEELSGDLDQYIENRAHDELEMVYPGEQVFINTAG